MLHELPKGELRVYKVDLSYLSQDKFDKLEERIRHVSYISQQVPEKQMLKVYWNCVESFAEYFNIPAGRVSPWPDSM